MHKQHYPPLSLIDFEFLTAYLQYNTNSGRNVSLTAHLLLTLHQVFPFLDGPIQLAANIARSRAMT